MGIDRTALYDPEYVTRLQNRAGELGYGRTPVGIMRYLRESHEVTLDGNIQTYEVATALDVHGLRTVQMKGKYHSTVFAQEIRGAQ